MKQFIIMLLLAIAVVGCGPHKPHKKMAKVHEYKIKQDNDFVFWYVIWDADGGSYRYTSPTQVTNFVGVDWVKTNEPIPEEATEQQVEEVNETDLSQDMQADQGIEAADMDANDSSADSGTDSGDSGGDSGGDGGGDGGGGDGGD